MWWIPSPVNTALLLERARLGFRLHGELDLCGVPLPDLRALVIWVLVREPTFLSSFQGILQDVLGDVCTGLPVPQPAAGSLAERPAHPKAYTKTNKRKCNTMIQDNMNMVSPWM